MSQVDPLVVEPRSARSVFRPIAPVEPVRASRAGSTERQHKGPRLCRFMIKMITYVLAGLPCCPF